MATATPTRYPPDTPGLRAQRACRNCVQIKAKCVPLEGSNNTTCQRCHRLRKECTTPAPVPRKRTRNKSTRVSQLEDKVNDLTSLLTTGSASSTAPQPLSISLPTPPVSTTHDSSLPCEKRPITSSTQLEAPDPGTGSGFQNLTPMVEEKLFGDFRTGMSRYFPFVVIPPEATIAEIRETKPLLFKTCLTAACRGQVSLQRQMAHECMKCLCDCLLIEGEKSMDLLQGLLVLIAWYQSYNPSRPQFVNLIHLASALLFDLGLNRPTHSTTGPSTGMLTEVQRFIQGKAVKDSVRTPHELRAILAVYYITGRFSPCYSLRWTSHLEDCCNALSIAAEYPSDLDAVHLARLQRIVEKYAPGGGLASLGGNVPLRTYVQCIEDDFQAYLRIVPNEVKNNNLAEMGTRSALIILYDSFVTMQCDEAIHKAEVLHTYVEHIRHFYDSFAAEPLGSIPLLPFITWLHMLYTLAVLAKLSFLVADGWDVQYLRSSRMDLATVADRLIAQLEAAVEHQNLEDNPQSQGISARLWMYVEKIRRCKKWYENKIQAEVEAPTFAIPNGGTALLVSDISVEGLFDGFDDLMSLDFAGDWTLNFPP